MGKRKSYKATVATLAAPKPAHLQEVKKWTSDYIRRYLGIDRAINATVEAIGIDPAVPGTDRTEAMVTGGRMTGRTTLISNSPDPSNQLEEMYAYIRRSLFDAVMIPSTSFQTTSVVDSLNSAQAEMLRVLREPLGEALYHSISTYRLVANRDMPPSRLQAAIADAMRNSRSVIPIDRPLAQWVARAIVAAPNGLTATEAFMVRDTLSQMMRAASSSRDLLYSLDLTNMETRVVAQSLSAVRGQSVPMFVMDSLSQLSDSLSRQSTTRMPVNKEKPKPPEQHKDTGKTIRRHARTVFGAKVETVRTADGGTSLKITDNKGKK